MPDLWFRGEDRDLEGTDLYNAHLNEVFGPVGGLMEGFYRGTSYAADGEWWRGTEAMVPKFMRDWMKSVRFTAEGALTRKGEPLIEDVSPWQALVQATGFTPAQLAERYRINTRLRNAQDRITDERQDLHRKATAALREGRPIPTKVSTAIRDFNRRYPQVPITSASIRQSLRARVRASQRDEFGVALNPKLNRRLRSERPPAIFN